MANLAASGAEDRARPVTFGAQVRAWLVALLCWLAVVVASFVVVVVFTLVRVDAVLAAADLTVELTARAWAMLTLVIATRFAAGALRRRRVTRAEWALVLPGAYYLYDLVARTEVPLWRNLAVAIAGMAACTAAITLWPAADRRRSRVAR